MPFAAAKLGLGGLVQVGAELGEGGQFAVLGEVEPKRLAATCFMALICALPPTRDTEMPTLIAGPNAGVEQVGFEIDLAVGDRDHVGRNVGRHVARPGFR